VGRKNFKKQIGEIKKFYEKNFEREKFIKWKKKKVHPKKICMKKEKKTGSGQGAALVASGRASRRSRRRNRGSRRRPRRPRRASRRRLASPAARPPAASPPTTLSGRMEQKEREGSGAMEQTRSRWREGEERVQWKGEEERG